MSRGVVGLIGLCFLVMSAAPAWAVTGYLGAGFDIFTDGSLRVREVIAGSPAEKAGVRAGDIVEAIDGQPPGTGQEVMARMTAAQPGQSMSLKLRRGGQTLTARAVLIDHSKTVAPASAPANAAGAAVPADTKAYCKAMYGKAYSLCGTLGDRDCKFLAADKWEQCEKTGRWP